jgi:hypothetical protein
MVATLELVSPPAQASQAQKEKQIAILGRAEGADRC